MNQAITKINYINTDNKFFGYEIYSGDEKIIYLTQENKEICCEVWGCAIFDDKDELLHESYAYSFRNSKGDSINGIKSVNLEKYIGSIITSVHWHKGKSTHKYGDYIKKENDRDGYGQDVATLDVNTTNGKLQLVVWTEHNGYYSHDYYAYFNGCESKISFPWPE